MSSELDLIVVLYALFRIFQCVVSLTNFLEVLLVWSLVHIRMVFFGQLAICMLKLLIPYRCVNLQDLVIRFIRIVDLLLLLS